tara:strand:+ start:2240 stop:2491 length:252 start_codon:yes stop_codon:yes gene_type:complete
MKKKNQKSDFLKNFEKKQKLFKKYGVYKNTFHNDGYKDSGGHINSKKPSEKKEADIYTGRTIRRKDYVNPVKIINNLNSKLKT